MIYDTTLNNTDKFSGGYYSTHEKGHNYQLLFKNFISEKINSILEVGTAHGGFAKFLKDNKINAKLIGADISPNDKHPHVIDQTKYNNLYDKFYIGDAYSQNFIKWILENNLKSDIVIDDGSHLPEHQKFLLSNVENLINENGVLICEDVISYEAAKYIISSVPTEYKKYAYIWDGTFSVGRSDDICVIVDTRS